MYSTLLTEIDEAIGLITLNRPERQNALDATLVAELIDALLEFQARPAVRVVVLSASGLAFCAGIDPAWLRHSEAQGEAAGMRDERLLAQLLTTLNELPKPTLARVQGPAYGAGIGLIAACDLAVASEEANFLFNDIRQGRIAASSAPFFLAAVGARQGRRYLLGGERFSAIEAYRIGLLHEVVPGTDELDAALGALIEPLLRGAPQAQAETKALLQTLAGQPLDEATLEEAVRRGARVGASAEAHEGLAAQAGKRAPNWQPRPRSQWA